MIIRYFSSVSLGLLVATGLLWLMQFLIDIGPEVITDPPPKARFSWLPERERKVIDEAFEPPDRPPPPIEPPEHRPSGGGDAVPRVAAPALPGPGEPEPAWDRGGPVMTDGPLVAMMSVRPVYPVQATARGLEGQVVVQFDVDERGAVINVEVLESSHRVFERAAVEAAKRSKFRPRVVDGIAVTTRGVRKLYRFELEQ